MKNRTLLSVLLPAVLSSSALFAAGKQCIPTPHRTTGTHYKAVTVHKVDVGRGVIVSGRVLSAADCRPIVGAKIAHWQAGRSGEYEDRLYAYLFSGKSGRYRFETEWPALPVPHIHFIVTAKGYKKVETQWVGSAPRSGIVFDIVLEPK